MIINLRIDGDYKPINITEEELQQLLRTGKFIKLGDTYYHVDHISRFSLTGEKKLHNAPKKPEPPQIMIKRG
ncbi:hypothetical protein PQE68_gp116 [Bacillus phage vB_BanS_Sophrita]|uniref:Uncharacterized protein n=1 Tax=Bacillus phage vB_BanS_Sophrita TaxID=2894790 RepID=A0AAE8YU96_9CAUD|nr:hypothetical protein PQE68_gp116 [Bacillus phage vB_BanS_Sophrita]UGO50707.1 hypothetical protein SOPHRITA_116 [Bacillus phage vB_BanS_Sophrita]